MSTRTGHARFIDSLRLGALYDDLSTEVTWIKRRIETIRILDDRRIERRVTLDIDSAEVRRRARRHGVFGRRLPLPIATLFKELQLDVDVRDSAGEPIAVTTSAEDSHLAHALILATLRRNGIQRASLPEGVIVGLYDLVVRPSLERLKQIVNDVRWDGNDTPARPDANLTEDERHAWQSILAIAEVKDLLLGMAEHYLFAVEVELKKPTVMIKYRYVEQVRMRVPSPLSQLGFTPSRFPIPIDGSIGTAAREHIRVIAPEDALMSRAKLLLDFAKVDEANYGYRQGSERVVVYTSGQPRGHYEIAIKLRPILGAFFAPAMLSTLFIAILLGVALYLETLDCRFSRDSSNADAAVAILALVPSLSAIYFTRVGEHHLVARLHFVPRMLVLLGAMLTVFCGGAVAGSVTHASMLNVFTVAFVYNISLVGYLGLVLIIGGVRNLVGTKSRFPENREDSWKS